MNDDDIDLLGMGYIVGSIFAILVYVLNKLIN